jgi:hypothetical protein
VAGLRSTPTPSVHSFAAASRRGIACWGLCALAGVAARAEPSSLLAAAAGAADFALVAAGRAAPIYVDTPGDPAISRAAGDLATDIARVSGVRPSRLPAASASGGEIVIIGELGRSPWVDRLAATGRIDVAGIRGQWESDLVQVVDAPAPGISRALVIAGSDARGAIYGIYDVSEAIGVSPWSWWADVPVRQRREIWISSHGRRQGPPAVKYRGIFLNDEDWGLRPWAAGTFDPATGNIGPKTYAKVFELLLRLRANCLWPAMHPGTRAFNFYPDDKLMAARYGIVMGSSHAEPMLRDNVDEWPRAGRGEYDYTTNRQEVLAYWSQRVRENARFENIYTVGMRGIHDGPMAGGGTIAEQADRLRAIIADQRALLRRWVDPDVTRVPQMFCPYKEVLPIYRSAPDLVPDDVTLVWPDDDYGYIQHYSSPAERQRSGGAGVYSHVSYWGSPYDYLWLCSTPPALLGEELTRAWDYGARRIWVLNVGDLKPAEIDIEFFLKLAWDPEQWRPEDGQHGFLRTMAARDFGVEPAEEIASILDEYYRLNFQRKPEHMGIDPTRPILADPALSTPFNDDEARRRIDAFAALSARADALGHRLNAALGAAYCELVQYPVRGAALMNQKGLNLGKYYAAQRAGRSDAAGYLAAARSAQAAIDRATALYNDQMAGGKWRGIMSDSPRDQPVFARPDPPSVPAPPTAGAGNAAALGWRLTPPGSAPKIGPESGLVRFDEANGQITLVAARASLRRPGRNGAWRTIGGLGYEGEAVAVFPQRGGSSPDAAAIRADSPCLQYEVSLRTPGDWEVTARRLPTWPIVAGSDLRYAVAFDDQPLQIVSCAPYQGENDPHWQHDVLRDAAYSSSRHRLAAGRHTLKIWRVDPGIVFDAFLLSVDGRREASYAWPITAPLNR